MDNTKARTVIFENRKRAILPIILAMAIGGFVGGVMAGVFGSMLGGTICALLADK
jgi:hypothetical protein